MCIDYKKIIDYRLSLLYLYDNDARYKTISYEMIILSSRHALIIPVSNYKGGWENFEI